MSGSYWTSTQRQKWQFNKASLAHERQKLWMMECQMFPQGLNIVVDVKPGSSNGKAGSGNTGLTTKNIPITHRELHYDKDYNLRIYCYFLIMKLGRRLNVRQQALATAHVYLSRFLLRASVREVNLYLLVTTCVYLACKVEECPQYIRNLVSEARSLWPEFVPPDATKVTEFEFYLIEELQCYLIVHHPYMAMEQIVQVLKLSPYELTLTADELQNCWSLINDSYINDVHMIYPPHIIAMACLFITISIKGNSSSSSAVLVSRSSTDSGNTQIHEKNQMLLDGNQSVKEAKSPHETFNRFMAESNVNLDEVKDTIQQQITLYDHWDKYHEPWVKFLLHTLYLRGGTT